MSASKNTFLMLFTPTLRLLTVMPTGYNKRFLRFFISGTFNIALTKASKPPKN